MPKFLVVYKRQNLKTNMKENLSIVISAEKFNKKTALKEFLKHSTADAAYTSPEYLYHRTFPKTFELPELNVWKPIVILRKGTKYYVATWHRYTNHVSEYFHLILPSSKANPDEGTAEFNRLSNLDIGYPGKKKNTELYEDDKTFYKYWKSSSKMYQIGVKLFDDLENLPDVLNHWYAVDDENFTNMYGQWGLTKKDITLKVGESEIEKGDIKMMMQFIQTGSTVQECIDHVNKALKTRIVDRARTAEIFKPMNLSPEVRARIKELWNS